jgi:hypothetical protein
VSAERQGNLFDRIFHQGLISYSNNLFSQYEKMKPVFNDEKRPPWLQEKIPPISSAG